MNKPDTPGGPGTTATLSRRTLIKTAAVSAVSASIPFLPGRARANTQESAMTAEQAAEVVRRGYHAFNTADLDLFSTLSTEDLTWETPGHSPIAGLKQGREAVYGQYGTYLNGTEGTFKAELKNVTAGDNGVVVGIHRNTGTRNGKSLDTMCCITFVVADGKIVSGKEHFFDLYNWDDFWS